VEASTLVTIDINPSIELAVSENSIVLDATPLNAAGADILDHIKVKRMKLEQCVRTVVEAAIAREYLAEMVLITASPAAPDAGESTETETILTQEAQAAAKAVIQKHKLDTTVQTLLVSGDLHREAKAEGLSDGKYAVLLAAQDDGVKVKTQDIKDKSLSKALKEAGAVPAEVIKHAQKEKPFRSATEKKGHDKGGPTDKGNGGQKPADKGNEGQKNGNGEISAVSPGRSDTADILRSEKNGKKFQAN
jgi:hypothetical protein